jgi:hypothetical protein
MGIYCKLEAGNWKILATKTEAAGRRYRQPDRTTRLAPPWFSHPQRRLVHNRRCFGFEPRPKSRARSNRPAAARHIGRRRALDVLPAALRRPCEGLGRYAHAAGSLAPDAQQLPDGTAAAGYLVTMVLMHPVSRVVHAIRAATVSPAFSSKMAELRTAQLAAPGFSPAAHDAESQAAYQKWPGSNAMVRSAAINETVGVSQTMAA